MNRILLVVILLTAVGAGIWLLMQGGSAPEHAEGQAAPAEAAVPEPGIWRGPEYVVPPPSSLQRDAAPPVASAAPEAPLYAVPAPEGEGFLVTVVRKDEGTAIPFADVFFVDVENLDQQRMLAARAEAKSLLDMIEQLAVRYQAGADGSVRLPLPAGSVWLAARKDRWFGSFDNQMVSTEDVLILCTQMSAVSARVTDAAGRPQADVPVQLRVTENGLDQAVLTVSTDDQGIGLIQPLDMLTRNDTTDVCFELALGGTLAETVRQEFDPRHPPAEPIELILPPHGILEVRVLTADGKPWPEPALIQALARDAEEVDGRMENEGLSGLLREGSLRLRPAGLGQPLRVRAIRPDGTTIGELVCEGPAHDGAVLLVNIQEQSGAAHVVGRAMRVDGQPLAKARLSYEIRVTNFGFSSSDAGQIVTADDGSFQLAIEKPNLDEGAKRIFVLSTAPVNGVQLIAETDLSWSLPPGATDIGNLLLAQPALLVSGWVVDESGSPLPGVPVQARPQVYFDKERFSWDWNSNFHARTDEEGAFALYGKTDSAKIRVTGEKGEHWCAGSDVAPGSTGVRVVMSRAGRVAGLILLDPGTKAEGFVIQLESEMEGDREVTHWAALVLADGSFNFTTVPPGVYRVEISPLGAGEPLASFDGLLVRAGEDCPDPRLNPIDLRGLLRVIRVRAVDEAGKPLRHFQVIENQADGNFMHYWANEDEVLLPMRAEPSDMQVMHDGYLTVRLEDVKADGEVRLLPGPRIRIVFSGVESLPPGHRLQVSLTAAEGALNSAHGTAMDVDAAGAAEFNAALTGLVGISLVMYGTIDNVTHGAWVEIENAEINVRAAAGTQSFTVNINPAKLQEAMDRIAQQREE
jgi:hypothetical protein